MEYYLTAQYTDVHIDYVRVHCTAYGSARLAARLRRKFPSEHTSNQVYISVITDIGKEEIDYNHSATTHHSGGDRSLSPQRLECVR